MILMNNQLLWTGFQSIGVTKEWRPERSNHGAGWCGNRFPINRRHQRMATDLINNFDGWSEIQVSNQ